MPNVKSPKPQSQLLILTSLRYLLRHPWQVGLCILGVAVGVAVVVSIDLANASAKRAFTLSTEAVAGRATHQIVGGPSGLDEDLYRQLRVDFDLRRSAPIVEGYASAPALNDLTMQVLGVDPFAEAPFRSYLVSPGANIATDGATVNLATLLVEPATAIMSVQTAQRYALSPGDLLNVRVGGQRRDVRIVGLIQPGDDLSARVLESMLLTDIATAQELLGMLGRLSRIDLILEEHVDTSELQSLLPPGAELTQPAARSNALEQMTRAFELNLTALSLLALIVGMFLIYNTMTFSVVQRRTLLGTLRCVGVTRRQIFALVLIEAVVIGLAGSLLGLLLGSVLGRGLVQLVTRTINDLYFVVTVRGLEIDPAVLLKGLVLGMIATMLAAALPALEATLTAPRTVLRRSSVEERVRRIVPLAALVGGALLVIGVVLLAWPNLGYGNAAPSGPSITGSQAQQLTVAFTALFAIIIGCALLTPGLTVALIGLARPLLGWAFGVLGRMAARDVVATLSRTSVAIAALMVAISVTIGVGIMVGSFRQTVIDWLDHSLIADVYVSSPSNTANRVDTTLDPGLVQEFSQTPGVAARTFFRNVQVNTPIGPVMLVAVQSESKRGRAAVRFRQGGGAATWEAFEQGALLISESLAYRIGLGVGDMLRLRTDRGEQEFAVAGVYNDYTSDRGIIRIDYTAYQRYWDDPAISSLALYVDPGINIDELVRQLRTQVDGRQEVVVASNQALRAGTLAIFDRTFAITTVLQMLATIVAFIGILSALMALQLERTRELGILRANGLTPRQLWGLVLAQTGLMGIVAGLLAIPVGLIMALILIYVINQRSFGWTLELSLDPALFAQALLVAVVSALLAGIYPALRMGRANPALALREE
ncbi:MAG: FtsX-like permease family protein [Chloroflexales bacterium]|nr:FtsX-like permease family protein [Chloroflexales bacterium]